MISTISISLLSANYFQISDNFYGPYLLLRTFKLYKRVLDLDGVRYDFIFVFYLIYLLNLFKCFDFIF